MKTQTKGQEGITESKIERCFNSDLALNPTGTFRDVCTATVFSTMFGELTSPCFQEFMMKLS